MKREAWALSLSLVAALLLLAGPLRAEECASTGALPSDKLAPSLFDPCFENVTFGEPRDKTIEHCAARKRAEYGVLMMAEKSAVEKDALKKRMETETSSFGANVTDFSGATSGFDASPLAADFAKHADEGLFETTKGTDRVYFLYSRNQLWKIVWVMDGKVAIEDLRKSLEAVYGKGASSKADERTTTWESPALRLELVDRRGTFNAYTLRWTSKEQAPKVEAYRREKGAVVAPAIGSNLGEDDVLNKALGESEKVDDVADDILGAKPKPIPDVAAEAKAQKEEKDRAKGIIKKKPKVLKQAPGPQPKKL